MEFFLPIKDGGVLTCCTEANYINETDLTWLSTCFDHLYHAFV